jgi:hypothetical protein
VAFTAAAGLLLGALRRRSGSLPAGAGLHWARNGLGMVIAMLMWHSLKLSAVASQALFCRFADNSLAFLGYSAADREMHPGVKYHARMCRLASADVRSSRVAMNDRLDTYQMSY